MHSLVWSDSIFQRPIILVLSWYYSGTILVLFWLKFEYLTLILLRATKHVLVIGATSWN